MKLAAAAMNTGDDLCLIILDVDHFKKFNDTWGHQTGDEVVKLVAATVQRTSGARIALQGMAARNSQSSCRARRLKAQRPLAKTFVRQWRHSSSSRESQKTISGITISLGVACYEPGEPLLEWIGRADNALYQAKHGGRNRVCSA